MVGRRAQGFEELHRKRPSNSRTSCRNEAHTGAPRLSDGEWKALSKQTRALQVQGCGGHAAFFFPESVKNRDARYRERDGWVGVSAAGSTLTVSGPADDDGAALLSGMTAKPSGVDRPSASGNRFQRSEFATNRSLVMPVNSRPSTNRPASDAWCGDARRASRNCTANALFGAKSRSGAYRKEPSRHTKWHHVPDKFAHLFCRSLR
ncbi:hypothetical protein DIPPA_30056 [Diplonema papillatum]|nr:hypothetical protein DIPPA_30056 [Diplonema papillatum]